MESRYGVGINNRYALFLDQDDVEDEAMLQKAAETAAATTKKAKETAQKVNGVAPAPKKDTKPAPPTQTTAPIKKPEAGKPPRGEDKENRGNRFEGKRVMDARKPQEGPREPREPRNREDRNNRRNKPDDENPSVPAPFGHDAQPRGEGEVRRGGRGGGRGGRGGGERGFGGDRGGERGFGGGDRGDRRGPRPRRDFDRKSGDDRTGVKSVDKREGGGSHNWGTFEDEIKAEEDKANTSTDEVVAEAAPAGETGDAAPTEEEPKPESDEPKVMTLDEYKKQLAAERSGPKFNLRKAGEGSEIDPKWKKTYAYKKEKETHEDDEDEEHELYPQRVNRQKRLMDIEINFADASRGGPAGGRGGRGGPRGGRGDRRGGGGDRGDRGDRGERGDRGDRGERPRADGGEAEKRNEKRGKPGRGRGGHAEAPNVNDEQSFPSLG